MQLVCLSWCRSVIFLKKRSYICLLMCCTGFAQIGLSLSQSLPVLYGFTFLATFFSITTQVLVPFAAGLASPQKSPQIVGTLMSGLFLGILLARSIAGLLSTVLVMACGVFTQWYCDFSFCSSDVA